MAVRIREFRRDGADDLSHLINASIIKLNSKDYPATVIDALCAEFSAANLLNLAERRQIFVAVENDRIVGTASLEEDTVHGVFVHPREIGRGIGATLMAYIERLAARQDVAILFVPSSITAHGFYLKLGYLDVPGVDPEQAGINIIMSKSLTGKT